MKTIVVAGDAVWDRCLDCFSVTMQTLAGSHVPTWKSQPLIAEKQGTVGSVTKNAIACGRSGDPHVVVAERLREEPLGSFAPTNIQHCTIRYNYGHKFRRCQAIHELRGSLERNEIAILDAPVRGLPVIAVKDLHFWWFAETKNALEVVAIIDPGAAATRQDAQ